MRSLVRACGDYLSPRDVNGHGTHTSSTAVGSVSTNVKLGGRYVGTAKGVAVNARLSFYKVFWCEAGAATSDLLTALNVGVADGVDLFSLSLGEEMDDFCFYLFHCHSGFGPKVLTLLHFLLSLLRWIP